MNKSVVKNIDRLAEKASERELHLFITEMEEAYQLSPSVEYAFDATEAYSTSDKPRWFFLVRLVAQLRRSRTQVPFSLHLGADWSEDLYFDRASTELKWLLAQRYANGEPVFRRIRLDVSRQASADSAVGWEAVTQRYPLQIFSFRAEKASAGVIEALYRRDKLENAEIICPLLDPEVRAHLEPAKITADRRLRLLIECGTITPELTSDLLDLMEDVPFQIPHEAAVDFESKEFDETTTFENVCLGMVPTFAISCAAYCE
jgi:hypothetical protein